MTLTIINQTIIRAPLQTIHNPIAYTRYLSKPSTLPFRTPGTNHNLIHTSSTFPNHPQSHSAHEVPFKAIHIPNPHTGYRPQPKPYFGHLSNPTTIPIHTRGTLPSYPQSHAIQRVSTITYFILRAPFQSNHHPNPYTRYLAKLSTILVRMPGTRPNHYMSTHIS
jgi:hypothetical protein